MFRRDVVEASVAERTATLAAVAEREGVHAALSQAESAMARRRRDASLEEELEQLAIAAAALAVAARAGLVEQAAAFHGAASRTLRRVGIDERGSRLSGLHESLARAAARAQDPDATDDDVPRSVVTRGAKTAALRLLEREIAGAEDDGAGALRLRLARARILRLSGALDESESLAAELLSEGRLRDEAAWEIACTRAQREGRLDAPMRALRTGEVDKTPERALLLHLWAHATFSKEWMREVTRATTLKRVSSERLPAPHLRAAVVVERAYEADGPITARVSAVEKTMAALDDADDPSNDVALHALAVAASARWLLRAKQAAAARRAVARYAALSESLSEGRTRDVFGLGLDVPEEPFVVHPVREIAIGRMALSLAGAWARRTNAPIDEYADIFTRHVSVLKGPLMKLGQMLSFYGFELTEDAQAALATLQDAAAPMPMSSVRRVVESELRMPLERAFQWFDPHALAAGSIGQVHAARLEDGTDVVVKVQYPDIEDAIRRDFRSLRVLMPVLRATFPHWDLRGILGELEQRMQEECDYRREAASQETFRARLADDREIVVPRVHRGISTRRVLVSDRFRGASFAEFAKTAPEETRTRAAETIVRYVIRTAIVERSFNTDMHPGNLLFDAQGRVCFLDFGSVRSWSADEGHGWGVILDSLLDDDLEGLARGFRMAGLVDGEAAFDAAKVHRLLVDHMMHAIVVDTEEPVDKQKLLREVSMFGPRGPLRDHELRIPPRYVYGFRIYWGLCAVLADLRVATNFRRVVSEVLAAPRGAAA